MRARQTIMSLAVLHCRAQTGVEAPLVTVEVHLSNGVELGPTLRVDLVPGEVLDIWLAATEESFTTWSADSEVAAGNTVATSESGEHDGDGD